MPVLSSFAVPVLVSKHMDRISSLGVCFLSEPTSLMSWILTSYKNGREYHISCLPSNVHKLMPYGSFTYNDCDSEDLLALILDVATNRLPFNLLTLFMDLQGESLVAVLLHITDSNCHKP